MRLFRRRVVTGGLLLGMLASMQGMAGAVVSGAPSPMCQSSGEGTSATARRVEDILLVGDTAYLGGRFNGLVPPAGGAAVARNRLGACSLTTGEALPWDPNADDTVSALATDGTSIFAGGAFKTVGGVSRLGLAALSPATGAVITAWKAQVRSGVVKALAVSGNTLYIGGTFTSVAGEPRNRLAAVNATTGALLPWDPGKAFDESATYDVRAIVVSGSRVIVGEYASNTMPNIMAVDAVSGARLSWWDAPRDPVLDLSAYGTRVYAAVAGIGGFVNAYDVATGLRRWQVATDGNVQAVLATSDAIYAGGHFDNVQTGWWRTTPRDRMLAVSPTGTLLPWNPGVDSSGQGVYVLRGAGTTVAAGGEFRFIGGKAHQGVVRFAP